MLVITWCTFLFAPGMPILFPIALFGMVVLYITNRIQLAYWHRRPPIYDQKMNETTIGMLSVAPALYLLSGAWVFSNQQAFTNTVQPLKNGELFQGPQHYVDGLFHNITPASIFLLCFALIALLTILRQIVNCCKIERFYSTQKKVARFQVRQRLASFFSSLKRRDRESLIKEELLDRERLNSSKLSKENLAALVLHPRSTS